MAAGDGNNFINQIADSVPEFLQSIINYTFGLLPVGWPSWIKVIAAFAIIIVVGRVIFWLVDILSGFAKNAFNKRKLLFFAPFGKSEWAGWFTLRRLGLTKSGGLFLGQWRKWILLRQDLTHHGEGHFITIAAPGGGKSTAAIVPTLLELKTGSVVVTDPKGELTAITRRHRESLGRVVYLNPFYEDFEKATGLEYPDSGFNPLDFIENNNKTRSQADNLARLLMVTDRQDSTSYFQDEGAEILSLFITWLVRHESEENRNFEYLYQLLRQNPQELMKWIDYAEDMLLKHDGIKFRDMRKDSAGQWAGAISKAQLATKRYVPTSQLAIHTSKSGFDPNWLKTENVTVYILVPTEHVQTAAPWLNMVVGLLGGAVGRAGKAKTVTFLLDELPALGYLPDLQNHMRQYRSSGLRMHLFSQTVAALSDSQMYGQQGMKDIFGQCGTKQFFSIEEMETAAEISKMCGEKTLTNRNVNSQDGTGFSTVGVPLIRAEDVLKLRNGQQIIIRHGQPIKAWLVPYFKRAKWRAMTDPNPYRE